MRLPCLLVTRLTKTYRNIRYKQGHTLKGLQRSFFILVSPFWLEHMAKPLKRTGIQLPKFVLIPAVRFVSQEKPGRKQHTFLSRICSHSLLLRVLHPLTVGQMGWYLGLPRLDQIPPNMIGGRVNKIRKDWADTMPPMHTHLCLHIWMNHLLDP